MTDTDPFDRYYDVDIEELNEQFERLQGKCNRVLRKDLPELKTDTSAERRRRLYNRILEAEQEFEDMLEVRYDDMSDFMDVDYQRGRFKAARLMLSVASEDAADGDGTLGGFSEEAKDAIREFDRYSAFEVGRDEEERAENLAKSIRRKEGEVYEFTERQVARQAASSEDVLSPGAEVSGAAMEYLTHHYNERLELAEEAVYLYIKNHGLPNTVEGIEEAVRATADASRERAEIEEALSEQMEELSERVHASMREQERSIRAEIAGIESTADGAVADEVDELHDRVEQLAEQQTRQLAQLEDRLGELRELEGRLDEEIEGLEETRRNTETDEDAAVIVEEELERMQEQREVIDRQLERLQVERERLAEERERVESEFESIDDRLRGTEPTDTDEFVPASLARLWEHDFLGRFSTSVHETDEVTLADGSTYPVPDSFAPELVTEGDRGDGLRQAVDEPEDYPVNRYKRFVLGEPRWVGGPADVLTVEAQVLSNLKAYAENGFDAVPAGINDLLAEVNRCIDEVADLEGSLLLCLASPTGWSDGVIEQVAEGEVARSRFDRELSICLLDLSTGRLVYDESDRRVAANAHLFEPPVESDRVEECVEHIREEYVSTTGVEIVYLEDVVESTSFRVDVVRKAIDRLAEAGVGERVVDGVGYSLELDEF